MLRSLTSFLGGNQQGLPAEAKADDVIVPESTDDEGAWCYLVVHTQLQLKSAGKEDGQCLSEGSLLWVDRRKPRLWSVWLHLRDLGHWVPDVCPKERRINLVEVEDREDLPRAVKAKVPIAVYPAPIVAACASPPARAFPTPLRMLEEGDVAIVSKRLRVVGRSLEFFALASGDGWVCNVLDQDGFSGTLSTTHEDAVDAKSTEQILNQVKWSSSVDASEQVERGYWRYLVIDPSGLNACTNQEGTSKETHPEGEVLEVASRELTRHGLRLGTADGMLFDSASCSKGCYYLTAFEVKFEQGRFRYEVVAERGVAIRARPSFQQAAKVGLGPKFGDIVTSTVRLTCGDTSFLQVEGGKGWVFDMKNGRRMMRECGRESAGELLDHLALRCTSPASSSQVFATASNQLESPAAVGLDRSSEAEDDLNGSAGRAQPPLADLLLRGSSYQAQIQVGVLNGGAEDPLSAHDSLLRSTAGAAADMPPQGPAL